MQKPVPEDARKIFDKAHGLFLQGRYDESLEAFNHYNLYAPKDARAWLAKAYIYAMKYDYVSARQALEETGDFKPADAFTFNLRGAVHFRLENIDAALADYEQALELDPGLASAWNNKAVIHQHRGEMEEAKNAYEKALDVEPYYTAALRHLAGQHKFCEGDAVFQRIKKAAEKQSEMAPANAAMLDYVLGKYYRDTGDMEKSFAAYAQGATRMKTLRPYDRAAQEKTVEIIKENFPEKFSRPSRAKDKTAPVPVFIVSMPRAGSTLVEQILSSHPRVHGVGEQRKLPHLIGSHAQYAGIDRDLKPFEETLANRARDYLAHLRSLAPGAEYVCDKLPYNFYNLGYIALMFPAARIIHVTRDPRDTCISCLTTFFAEGHEWSFDLRDLGHYYNLYRGLMDHWRKVLPENFFIDVAYEDLVAEPEKNIRRMLDYCGLEWSDSCLEFHSASRNVRTASAAQVRNPLYSSSIGRWRAYEPWIKPLLEAL